MKQEIMKKAFPDPSERLVASALLLLSDPDCPFTFYEDDDAAAAAKIPSHPAKKPIVNGKEKMKKKKSTQRDCRQNDNVSSRRFKIVSIKVARKRRSMTEVYSKSPECKMTSSDKAASSSSCVTTATSSSESSIRRRREEEEYLSRMKKKKKEGYIRRRAEAILGVLESGQCYSEIDIRKFYGDNPTTSKALRL